MRAKSKNSLLTLFGIIILTASSVLILWARSWYRPATSTAQSQERVPSPIVTSAQLNPSPTPTDRPALPVVPSPIVTSAQPDPSLTPTDRPTLPTPSPSCTQLPPTAVTNRAQSLNDDHAPPKTPRPRDPKVISDTPVFTPAPSPKPELKATPTIAPVPLRIVRIMAPTIGLDAPVIEVGWLLVERDGQKKTVWETASFAAGHHKNSARPGQGGNIVLSGHHNIEGEVFKRLVELKPGDKVILETEGGGSFTYQVTETMILPEAGASLEQRLANAQYMAPTTEERLTLITCWPYWTNTHRVIVIARPILR